MMDGRYNLFAKETLMQANKEARRLGHRFVGTEHIFLALLKKDEDISNYFKRNYGITYEIFNDKIINIIGIGNNKYEEKMLTPIANRVVNANDIIANSPSGSNIINNLILLRAIIEEREGIAIRILMQFNVDLDRVEQDILDDKIRVENKKESGGFYMNKIYDCLVVFDKKELKHIKRIPIINVDKKTFDKFESGEVTLTEDFASEIYSECYVYSKNGIEMMTAVIIATTEPIFKYIVVAFNKNDKGNFITSAKCSVDPETERDLLSVVQKTVLYTSNIIKKYSKSSMPIISTANIYNEVIDREKVREEKINSKKRDEELNKKISKLSYLTNLNEQVKKKNIKIIGFDKELEELIKGLSKMRKPNVIIKGEPGVGKTALVEKLACAINDGCVPDWLLNKKIYQMFVSNVVAGTKYRGEFEEKMKKMIDLLEENPDIILFIDEIHMMVGSGSAEGSADMANIFKPALARGNIRVIGATTNDEYDRFIKRDGALERRFSTIELLEPTEKQVKEILRGLRKSFETFYGIKITDEDIENAYNNSKTKRGLMPDVALDELENFCIEKKFNNKREKEKI